jgi:sodium pump decarboxylase gamma subunit
MMEQGLILMAAGMGTVFAFLVIMVFAMHASSAILNRYFPDKTPPPKKPNSKKSPPKKKSNQPGDLSDVAAAIAVATARMRGAS